VVDIENVLIRVGNKTIRLEHVEQFTVIPYDEGKLHIKVAFTSGREQSFTDEEAQTLKTSLLLSLGIDLGDGTSSPEDDFIVFET